MLYWHCCSKICYCALLNILPPGRVTLVDHRLWTMAATDILHNRHSVTVSICSSSVGSP